MRSTTTTCDTCGRDLTTTGNEAAYLVAVTAERIPSLGPVVTAMAAYPALRRSYHFCDLRCLRAHPIATAEGSVTN